MILVTGDVVLDHNVYAGQQLNLNSESATGLRHSETPGCAMLVYKVLEALKAAGKHLGAPIELAFGLEETSLDFVGKSSTGFKFGALWHAMGAPGEKVWRMTESLGYSAGDNHCFPAKPSPQAIETVPSVLVIEDAGLGFRSPAAQQAWPRCLRDAQPPDDLKWVILKLSGPLASGSLWQRLMEEKWCERLIVIVSADQLRSEGIRVAGGLSWESSVDDIIDELESSRALRGLMRARHLVVTMRSDAALWLKRSPGANGPGELVFDRSRCEGEWEEQNKEWNAYGFDSIVTASAAWSVASALNAGSEPSEIDLSMALASGLSAARFLRMVGHGPASAIPSFPFADVAAHITNELNKNAGRRTYSIAEIRSNRGVEAGNTHASGRWTILGQVSPWHTERKVISLEPARRVALLGPSRLQGVPCATFGKLQTFDRHEIDSLRALRQAMLLYRETGSWKQPLCVGVFGAPGSGKSFGLKQIAKGVFGSDCPILEFNLSQFRDDDLIGAFHQVRDAVLSGKTPTVFWDEFDSNDRAWLHRFLAPMQDGAFQEGQVTHFMGKSVFVFAGGTAFSFAEFNETASKDKAKKGPDFLSRLSAYLNIAGPNPRETEPDGIPDLEYPVRRALVIRTALDLGEQELRIERGLLSALLGVRKYRNGARSLDRLVRYIHDRGGFPLRRAYLPPDGTLALHIEDVREFHMLTQRFANFYAQADKLAPMMHLDYLRVPHSEEPAAHQNVKPWEQLDQEAQDSNFAAALRMPRILEQAGLTLEEGDGTDPNVNDIIQSQLDTMAAAEHEGWEEHRRMHGWTYARRRNNKAFRHNLLVSFDRLSDAEKEYDRNTIRNYCCYAKEVGFRIVPMAPVSTDAEG